MPSNGFSIVYIAQKKNHAKKNQLVLGQTKKSVHHLQKKYFSLLDYFETINVNKDYQKVYGVFRITFQETKHRGVFVGNVLDMAKKFNKIKNLEAIGEVTPTPQPSPPPTPAPTPQPAPTPILPPAPIPQPPPTLPPAPIPQPQPQPEPEPPIPSEPDSPNDPYPPPIPPPEPQPTGPCPPSMPSTPSTPQPEPEPQPEPPVQNSWQKIIKIFCIC